MECADGEKVEVDVTSEVWDDNWDACFNRNSQIFRCPFPYIPCEDMWERKMDFKCGINCASKGGKRQTCNGGMNTLNLTQVVNKCLFRYEVFCWTSQRWTSEAAPMRWWRDLHPRCLDKLPKQRKRSDPVSPEPLPLQHSDRISGIARV